MVWAGTSSCHDSGAQGEFVKKKEQKKRQAQAHEKLKRYVGRRWGKGKARPEKKKKRVKEKKMYTERGSTHQTQKNPGRSGGLLVESLGEKKRGWVQQEFLTGKKHHREKAAVAHPGSMPTVLAGGREQQKGCTYCEKGGKG